MVLGFYKLREQPFGVTPDPRYLFLSPTHREGLASILYGLEGGCGFVVVIAEPGLGKTTLLFQVLSDLRGKSTTVFLSQNIHTPVDLLRAVLDGLGINDPGTNAAEMQSKLQRRLEEQFRLGKRVVLVIDEAQNLDNSVLESVRMLSNFETPREKLIQIILCGQPQLAKKIASPDLIQLRQRVSIFARLDPLSAEETDRYIRHRLKVAGYECEPFLFNEEALSLLFKYSEGVPRSINNLCFNALSIGCALKQATINAETVFEVIGDLDIDRLQSKIPLNVKMAETAVKRIPASESTTTAFIRRNVRLLKLAAILATLAAAVGVTPHPTRRFESILKVKQGIQGLQNALGMTTNASLRPATLTGAASTRDANQPSNEKSQSKGDDSPGMLINDYASATRALSGRTLLGICSENFGKCDASELKEIKRLNPRLEDTDHSGAWDRIQNDQRRMLSRETSRRRWEKLQLPKGAHNEQAL